MSRKIAIIGNGNVGSALTQGLQRAGYEVRSTGHDAKAVREAAQWGEMVILAVPWSAVDDAVREMGDALDGKPLVDTTNPLTSEMQLAVGCTSSAAEELQKKAPRAKVVKSFNMVFAKNMSTGKVRGEPLSLFTAGDDAEAKRLVLDAGRDIGFDPVDAGPLRNARWLETLAYLNIQLGYAQKMGTDMGFKLVH